MVLVPQDEVNRFCDVACLSIWGAIDITHRYGARQRPSGQPVSLDVVSVYEAASGSRIHQGIHRLDFARVRGFNADLEQEGARGGIITLLQGGNDEFSREAPLPMRSEFSFRWQVF